MDGVQGPTLTQARRPAGPGPVNTKNWPVKYLPNWPSGPVNKTSVYAVFRGKILPGPVFNFLGPVKSYIYWPGGHHMQNLSVSPCKVSYT